MSERYVVGVGSGLYRGKPSERHEYGKPYHKAVYILWDTKAKKSKQLVEIFQGPGAKEDAERKCARMNQQATMEP